MQKYTWGHACEMNVCLYENRKATECIVEMFHLAEGIPVTFPLFLSYKHAMFFAVLCSKASSDIKGIFFYPLN